MAVIYRCSKCQRTLTVGVPTVTTTRQVSEDLSVEFGRLIVYHDWSPSSTDRALRDRAEQLWQEKCDEYYRVSENLRALPDACPHCGATYSWNVSLSTLVIPE